MEYNREQNHSSSDSSVSGLPDCNGSIDGTSFEIRKRTSLFMSVLLLEFLISA